MVKDPFVLGVTNVGNLNVSKFVGSDEYKCYAIQHNSDGTITLLYKFGADWYTETVTPTEL